MIAMTIIYSYTVIFNKHDNLYLRDNFHLLKYAMTVSENCFDSFNFSNETVLQISKIRLL